MSFFSLNGVSKIYQVNKTDFYALRNINLALPSKGFVSITGKSGSGKSTLLNLLMCIEKPTRGEVFFQNKRIDKMSKSELSSYHLNDVAMVYQHYNLFDDLSPLDNVMLPLLMRGESKTKAKEKALDLFNKFSLNYLLNQKTKTLSGGEKQRIALLRTIIIEPKAVLADEPTGALDSMNGILVMETLKKISEDILVVMVSHDQKLVEKYSDFTIEMKDGTIVKNPGLFRFRDVLENKDKKRRYSGGWKTTFLRKNIHTHMGKNAFSLFASIFGFLSIMLSIGFSVGSKLSQDSAIHSNLGIGNAFLYQETLYNIENSPLNYVKKSRPNLEEVDDFISEKLDAIIAYNYDYLFTPYPEIIYQREVIERAQFVPIFDFDSELFSSVKKCGLFPKSSFLEIAVNEEFAKLLSNDIESVLNSSIFISSSADVSYYTGDHDNPIIKDRFSYSFEMKITAIVEEFAFLNTPKVYYSYLGLESELKNTVMENVSDYLGELFTYYDYIDNSSDDSVASSYSYNLFISTREQVDSMFSLIEDINNDENTTKIVIESSSYDVFSTYNQFMDTFSRALYIFVIIAILGVNFIIGMISLSSFIEQKKESAILSALGARESSICSIFLEENYLVIVIAFIIAVALSFPLQFLLNNIFYNKFLLSNLIAVPFESFLGIRFLFAPLVIVIAILMATLFVIVPLSIYKSKSISEELRDE